MPDHGRKLAENGKQEQKSQRFPLQRKKATFSYTKKAPDLPVD